MKFLEIQLHHCKVMLTQFAPHTSDPREHDHGDEYQLSIPLLGPTHVQRIGEVCTLAGGRRRLVTAPHEPHFHFANEEASRLLLINFSQAFLEQVIAERVEGFAGTVEFVPYAEGATDGFRKLAHEIIGQSMHSSLERVELQQIEWELAHLLLDSQTGSHTEAWRRQSLTVGKHPALQRVLDCIHDDPAAELSLDRLADLAGLSKFHLIRLFREQIGSTPSQYLHEIRLERARHLLITTHRDVTAIAFEVGYGSLSAFERAFKKRLGVSAQTWRQEIRP